MLPVVVIPAYQPEKILLAVINELKQLNSELEFIILDDGSTTEVARQVFEELAKYSNLVLLKHNSNQGKGSALKTAFAYFLENYPESVGVVTADADGQHLPKDIYHIIEALKDHKELVLGVRKFSESVPLRSRLGNETTRKFFGLFSGISIQDTQTGLRGISKDLIPNLLSIEENGYAFEMNMLVQAVKEGWKVKEISITTVYIEQNRSSHFNPLLDSLRIYFVFIRYSALSLISAGIDFLLFFLSFHVTKSIPISTVVARALSGAFNFTFCKKLIFKSNGKMWWEGLQYIGLAVMSIIFSSLLVSFFFYHLRLNIFASKLFADSMIFIGNFIIQRMLIFRSRQSA